MEEELSCEWEIGNAHDTHAVGICKTIDSEVKTVGHVPHNISSIYSIFYQARWSVQHQKASPVLLRFATGGLEIPCTLKFISHKENKAAKVERLLESALGIEVRARKY